MKKGKHEASDFDSLKTVGYELAAPQDEFSYQPDSNSLANGILGKQENGVDSDFDAADRQDQLHTQKGGRNVKVDLTLAESSALESPRSLDELLDSPKSPPMVDRELYELIRDRFSNHPHLCDSELKVSVLKGEVLVEGEVKADSAKLLITEILEALPSVTKIFNRAVVR